MGTVYDQPGIKRFGLPHIKRRGALWTIVATARGDAVGRQRNKAAARWAWEANDRGFWANAASSEDQR